jgi:hypothetical protein
MNASKQASNVPHMLSLLMRHARSLFVREFHLNFLFLVFCFAGKKDDGEGSGACMLSLFYASFMARSH